MSRQNPLYDLWGHIKSRCTSVDDKAYADYGGRGIAVCDEWRHNFQAFYDHVSQLLNFGDKGYTLDRINNNGNYEPGNVRWATRTEQNRNSRHNRMITYNGETKCLAEWAQEIGIDQDVIARRLTLGWTPERTLTQKLRRSKL